jgi:hypothetical protein
MLYAFGFAALLAVVSTLLHYAALRLLSAWLPHLRIMPRPRPRRSSSRSPVSSSTATWMRSRPAPQRWKRRNESAQHVLERTARRRLRRKIAVTEPERQQRHAARAEQAREPGLHLFRFEQLAYRL